MARTEAESFEKECTGLARQPAGCGAGEQAIALKI